MSQLFRYLLAVGLMVSSIPAALNARGEDKHDRNCCDTPRDNQEDIVGPWLFNRLATTDADKQFGVINFLADGNVVQHISAAISQETAASPNGDFFTINVGIWKKTGKNTYKVIHTGVWLRKDMNDTQNDLHGIPLARLKTEYELCIDKDCLHANAEGWTTFFNVDDLTLTHSNHIPLVTPPVPVKQKVPFTATLRRLLFK